MFFAIIFICAGRINYWQGLVYLAIGVVMVVLNYTVLRIDSQLMAERSKSGKDTKKWACPSLGSSSCSQDFLVFFIEWNLAEGDLMSVASKKNE